MDMLSGEEIAAADLSDWRKLAQGLHARYVVDDFGTGARFLVAVGEAGDALGHHPHVSMGDRYVDLELVSDDAIYREEMMGRSHLFDEMVKARVLVNAEIVDEVEKRIRELQQF